MNIRETAPLYFNQYSTKSSFNYSADHRTLFYYDSSRYTLDYDRTSNATLDTPITVPNFPLIALLSQVERFHGVNNYMPLMPLIGGTILDSYSVGAINALLRQSNESLFIRVTPRQLIDGYEMKLGTFINEFVDAMMGNSTDNQPASKSTLSSSKFKQWFCPDDANRGKNGFLLHLFAQILFCVKTKCTFH